MILGVAQVTIFPAVDALGRGDGIVSFSPLEYLSTHGDFDGYQSTINIVAWIDNQGPMLGRQLLSAVLFFVPRSFWSWKSPGTGIEAADFVGYPYINISAPMPGELYADFHLFGLILFSCLLGRIVRRVDESLLIGEETRKHRCIHHAASNNFWVCFHSNERFSCICCRPLCAFYLFYNFLSLFKCSCSFSLWQSRRSIPLQIESALLKPSIVRARQ